MSIDSGRFAGLSLEKFIENQRKRGIDVWKASTVTESVRTIPSGSLLLDRAIGLRGYPVPRTILVFGEPKSGKSTLTYLAEATATRNGYPVVRCDTENDLDNREAQDRRKSFGVDLEKCIDIPGRQTAEKILDVTIELLNEFPEIRVVTIDSASALTSTSRDEKKLEKGHIDDTPRILSQFCKKINAANRNAIVFVVCHTMSNIGSMSPRPIHKGGKAVEFYAGLKLWVKGGNVPESRDAEGFHHQHMMDVVVEKNKFGPFGGRANNLIFDNDRNCFDLVDELITICLLNNILQKKGSWIVLQSGGIEIREQGRNAFKEWLVANPAWFYELFKMVTGKTYEEYFTIC